MIIIVTKIIIIILTMIMLIMINNVLNNLSPRFYASCIILHNLKKLLAHFKAIFIDVMQNLHNWLIFLDFLHNPGKFWSSFAQFEIIKKGCIIINYVLHKTAGTEQQKLGEGEDLE